MINFTTFADAKDFYRFWDKQNHTTHNKYDFALRAICVSIFNDESEDQCIERLKRSFGPCNTPVKLAGDPATTGGRWPYDTLYRTLTSLLSFDGYYLGTFKGKLAPKDQRNEQGLIREQARLLLKSLADKIARSASQSEGEANDAG